MWPIFFHIFQNDFFFIWQKCPTFWIFGFVWTILWAAIINCQNLLYSISSQAPMYSIAFLTTILVFLFGNRLLWNTVWYGAYLTLSQIDKDFNMKFSSPDNDILSSGFTLAELCLLSKLFIKSQSVFFPPMGRSIISFLGPFSKQRARLHPTEDGFPQPWKEEVVYWLLTAA